MLYWLRNSVVTFFLVSLLFHAVVYTSSFLFDTKLPIASKEKVLEFVVVEKIVDQKKQIVEQDKFQINKEIPEDAKFMGRHNQKVIKQTRAAHNGDFSNTAQPGMRKKGSEKAEKKKKGNEKLGTLPTLDKLRPVFSMTPKAYEEDVIQVGKNSQTNDHIKDVDKGLQTLLSTREFVYYSYYQRIRDKIRSRWEPMIRDKVRKVFASGRTIASSRDRVTQVVIILDKSGSLITVKVIGQSGLTDIDDAAIEAFKLAEPFPNPPKGIIENDGTIRIRWDFVLEARRGPPPVRKQKRVAKRDQP